MADAPRPTLSSLLADEVDLAELSDEALAARREQIEAAAAEAAEGELTSEVTALLAAAATHVETIVDDQTQREADAAALVAAAQEAMAKIASFAQGDDDDTADDGDAADAGDADEPVKETVTETTTEVTETTEVEASAAKADVTAATRAKARRPAVVPARARARTAESEQTEAPAQPIIRATGEARGITVGQQFTDPAQLNEAMFEKWLSLAKSKDGNPHMLGTIDYRHMYGPEQRLDRGSPDEVTDKVMAFVNARRAELSGNDGALAKLRVASGGVPGPAEARYAQITYGQADRPVRDALPQFLAQRGSITYNNSPTLADILLDTSLGAIGTVTSAQDLAGATKNIQEISAPTAVTVTVEANTLRWAQGNFADRFYPERTAAFMRLGQVAFARHNEALRLADIKTNCTKLTNTIAEFGAYRDLKSHFLGELAHLRDLIRDYSVPIRVIMPAFVPAMLAMDLTRQQPGDDAYDKAVDEVRREIEGWDSQVTVTWAKDSIRGRLLTSPSGQSPRTANFDADVEWCMFPEGAFLFLDGGMLDLGILRDTVVSATNKFQTFFESWEAIAPLVSTTLCRWITSSLCADGKSQVAASVTACSASGS